MVKRKKTTVVKKTVVKKTKPSEEVKHYAYHSNLAYSKPEERQEYLSKFCVDCQYDKKLSTKYVGVSKNHKSKEVIISLRGTEITDPYDLAADLAIATGSEAVSSRWLATKAHIAQIQAAYGTEHKYVLTGHSLGGRLAEDIGAKLTNTAVHSFNAGSGISAVRNTLSRAKRAENITSHYIDGDVLSVTTNKTGKNIHVYANSGKGNSHSLQNFLN